jgi:hypothetical protein
VLPEQDRPGSAGGAEATPGGVQRALRDAEVAAGEEVSPEEFEALLAEHARLRVDDAHARLGGPLCAANMEQFLGDSACLRWKTRVVFDDAPLEAHQFAHPVVSGPPENRECTLYVRPIYARYPESLPYFAAYFAAVINYGIAAGPELCEMYGAGLMALSREAFYDAICRWADLRE